MRATIGKRITIGFAATVLITAALGAFTFEKLHGIASSSRSVTAESLPGIKRILMISNLQRLNVAKLLDRRNRRFQQ